MKIDVEQELKSLRLKITELENKAQEQQVIIDSLSQQNLNLEAQLENLTTNNQNLETNNTDLTSSSHVLLEEVEILHITNINNKKKKQWWKVAAVYGGFIGVGLICCEGLLWYVHSSKRRIVYDQLVERYSELEMKYERDYHVGVNSMGDIDDINNDGNTIAGALVMVGTFVLVLLML